MRFDVKRLSVAMTMFAALAIQGMAEDRVRVATDDALRAAVSKMAPLYSPMARQLKLEGEVKADVSISEDGTVENVSSVSGNPVLFQCVKDAVRHWKFTPFKAEGKPAKAVSTLSFSFKL